MGIIEGLTEFLPISSIGYLHFWRSDLLDPFNDEKGKVFAIVIQLGAILAVCWEYPGEKIKRCGFGCWLTSGTRIGLF